MKILVLVLICACLGILSTIFLSNKSLDDCPHNEDCCHCSHKDEE